MGTESKKSTKAVVKIVGAVPRSVKDPKVTDRAYASARKEMRDILTAASTRRAKTG